MAQLEIRPQKEASAESKIQTAYGDKYDFWTMIGAKCEVAEMLDEEEPRSGSACAEKRLKSKELRDKALLGPRKTKIVDGSGDTLLLFSKDRIYRMHLLKNSA